MPNFTKPPGVKSSVNQTHPPQNERTAFRPRNPYGVAKAYAHWMTINYRQQYNLYTCCGITYTHESPRRGSATHLDAVQNYIARCRGTALPCPYEFQPPSDSIHSQVLNLETIQHMRQLLTQFL